MRDDRDYKVELSSVAPADKGDRTKDSRGRDRPFVSVQFGCCNVYCRIYRNLDATRYEGRCPRCGRPVVFLVGAGGTDARFFVVN